MTSKKVIDLQYLPVRPVGLTTWLVCILAFDYWLAPLWLWYIGCTVLGVVTVACWLTRFASESWVHPSELPKA